MIRQGCSTSLLQGSQQWSTISSSEPNTGFASPLSRMNCQMFSCGLSSGLFEGIAMTEMLGVARAWASGASRPGP